MIYCGCASDVDVVDGYNTTLWQYKMIEHGYIGYSRK